MMILLVKLIGADWYKCVIHVVIKKRSQEFERGFLVKDEKLMQTLRERSCKGYRCYYSSPGTIASRT